MIGLPGLVRSASAATAKNPDSRLRSANASNIRATHVSTAGDRSGMSTVARPAGDDIGTGLEKSDSLENVRGSRASINACSAIVWGQVARSPGCGRSPRTQNRLRANRTRGRQSVSDGKLAPLVQARHGRSMILRIGAINLPLGRDSRPFGRQKSTTLAINYVFRRIS